MLLDTPRKGKLGPNQHGTLRPRRPHRARRVSGTEADWSSSGVASVDLTVTYPSGHLFSMMMGRFGLSSTAGKSPKEGPRTGNAAMQPFRILEHTADVGFEAFGSTREEVFANAARALIYLIVELDTITTREEVALQVQRALTPRAFW